MSENQKDYYEGWLKKKKSDESNGFFSKFNSYNKRWFIIDTEARTFSYSDGQKKKIKKEYSFDDITGIEEAHDQGQKAPGKWKFKFTVMTTDKAFDLFSRTEEEWKIWVESLKAILVPKEDPSKKKKKKKKSKKNKKKDKSIDMDQIFVKRGPRETVKLEPSAPLEMVELNPHYSRPSHENENESGMNKPPMIKRKRTNLEQYNFRITQDFIEPSTQLSTREGALKLRDSDLSKNDQATNNTSKNHFASSSSLDTPEKQERGPTELVQEGEAPFEENWDEDFGTIEDITHKKRVLNY
ncbi:unnamed protein product [Moneuplotes crassus]|uniref:PH domain-containing protein n=1 Tax=Euplotes crassus TaxID=5936 RepID=A0AAD1X8B9_EUPCR|nr:unnamed protein product [Moneuplotes crassus]